MNAWTPTPIQIQLDAQPCAADATRLERQLALLDRLAEAGLNIVLEIERQAIDSNSIGAGQAAPSLGDLALAYARASRAVRMTIALQSRLIDERQERGRKARFAEAPDRQARIERIVTRVAQAEHDGDDETVERLAIEAAERLDDGDLYGDVLARPVSEIVAEICRDLDLSPDWAALAGEGWAREEIDSGAVGSPLAALAARPPPSRPERRRPPPAASP